MLSPHELVKEVSKFLAKDYICYVHRASRELTEIEISKIDTPENQVLVSQLEGNISRYIKCKPMPTQDMIWVMKNFLLEMTDDELGKELSSGLNRKKPTRNFLQILESRPDIKQHWSLFKAEQYEDYVAELFIKDYNY